MTTTQTPGPTTTTPPRPANAPAVAPAGNVPTVSGTHF
jgi:hypothetical protein